VASTLVLDSGAKIINVGEDAAKREHFSVVAIYDDNR
jgi:hypothetical protein